MDVAVSGLPGGNVYIGTAGWTVPTRQSTAFDGPGSHLERYARRLNAVEVNSCFYRHHQPATYERWAASVPSDFRFSVKLPRALTHEGGLHAGGQSLARFADEVAALGPKLGAVLVQLPPSLAFDPAEADVFFDTLTRRLPAPLVCEPRHPSWADGQVMRLLERFGIARVAADPARFVEHALPGGARRISYVRAHGAPRMYYSEYDAAGMAALGRIVEAARGESSIVWCIFDNTGLGYAIGNALEMARTQNLRADGGGGVY